MSSPSAAPAPAPASPPRRSTTASPSPSSFTYPYASSPDIIRSHQKDIHQTNVLQNQLTSLLRHFYGSRFTHTYDTAIHTFSELLYLGLTTLIGNRTLGEEYTDIHQVEASTGRLPTVGRRARYILGAVLVPYALGKGLPRLRTRLRAVLERRLAKGEKGTKMHKVQAYLLQNLGTFTATAPVYAITLAAFYFSGSYYHLSKRVFGLRYIFPRKLAPGEQRDGYEVLGVLLVMQMIVQSYLHVKDAMSSSLEEGQEGGQARLDPADIQNRLAISTHTPRLSEETARYDLSDESTMGWLQPAQQRKCTLCLEPMKDPSVTTCGHMFCWTCITNWIHERPECPLCRQGTLGQHVLPLRG